MCSRACWRDSSEFCSPLVWGPRLAARSVTRLIGIECAMIGGASLAGGVGSVGGTVIASFILSTLSMGLTMMNANPNIPTFLNGFVVLGAVYLDQIRIRK